MHRFYFQRLGLCAPATELAAPTIGGGNDDIPPVREFKAEPSPSLMDAVRKELDPNRNVRDIQDRAAPVAPVAPAVVPAVEPKLAVEPQPGSGDALNDLIGSDAPKPAAAPEIDVSDIDKKFPDGAANLTDPKAIARWGEIKGELKSERATRIKMEQERQKLADEIAELKKSPTTVPADVEDLRKKVQDFEARDAVFKLEHDPDFVGKVMKPLNDAYTALDRLNTKYKISPDSLRDAMAKEDPTERNDALSKIIEDAGMNALNQGDFTKNVQAVQDLEFKQREAYESAGKLNEAARTELTRRQTEAQQKREASLDAAEKDVWEKLSTQVEIVKDILKDDTVALDVRKRATEFLKSSEKTPEMEAYHAIAPFLVKPLRDKCKALNKELDTYKARVKELTNDEQPPAGGGRPSMKPPMNAKDDNLKPGEGVARAMAAMGKA